MFRYSKSTKIDPLNVGSRVRKQIDEPSQPRRMLLVGCVVFDLYSYVCMTWTFLGLVETPMPGFYTPKSERPLVGDIGYNPTLGIVPEMSLPDNLPDLGNYATFDNDTAIDWTKETMASIAPSFVISMLPDINDFSSTSMPSVQTIPTEGRRSF
jgi:hypothetical protein